MNTPVDALQSVDVHLASSPVKLFIQAVLLRLQLSSCYFFFQHSCKLLVGHDGLEPSTF